MKKSKLRRMKFENWLLGKLNKILYKIYLRGGVKNENNKCGQRTRENYEASRDV